MSLPDDRPGLSGDFGEGGRTLSFAGDFTSLKTGWVEGAIEAGLQAARQIDPLVQAEGRPVIRQRL
ncbi:FAD-dependent oxidoreductase [Methylobacterium sp. CM6247]